jgi:hypothetical protein
MDFSSASSADGLQLLHTLDTVYPQAPQIFADDKLLIDDE